MFFLAVGNDRQFRDLTDVLGDPAIADDRRFASNADRVAQRDSLRELLAPRIRQWQRADLAGALRARGVPSGPVHSVGEALTDAQVLHREMVISRDGYRGAGIPVKPLRTPGSVRTIPHDQGEDTAAVLRELGYSDDEIAAAQLENARDVG